MANDVEIRVTTKGDREAKAALGGTEKAVRSLDAATEKAGKGSRNYGAGLDRVSKHAGGLESGMGGLADGISGVTTLMEGGAQGGAGLALAFADIGSAASNTAIPAVKGIGRGLGGLRGLIKGVGTAASGDMLGGLAKGTKGLGLLGAGITKLVDKLGGLRNVLVGGGIVAGITGIVVGIKALESAAQAREWDHFIESLQKGQQTIDETSGKALLMATAFGNLDGLLKKVAAEGGTQAAEQLVQLAEKAGAPASAIAELKGQLHDLGGGFESARMGFGGIKRSADDAEESIRGVNDALRAQFDPVFAAADAQRGLNDALAQQAEVNRDAESTAADKAAADAGVRKAVVDLESATNDLNSRVREGTLDVEEASRQFVDMATRMGIPEGEARRLADQIYGATKRSQELGRQRPTPVLRVKDLASGTINAVQGLIRNFGGTVATASLRLQVIGLQEANRARALVDRDAHGGIVGAQSGGIHGGLRLVGEQGPELVRLPTGSMVRSNPDTRRMLAAGGAQRLVVDINLAGGGDMFLRWLRSRIAADFGGNVQAALGRR